MTCWCARAYRLGQVSIRLRFQVVCAHMRDFHPFFFFSSFVRRKSYELKLKAQIKEAEANAFECQAKVDDLSYKISELERDLTNKTWNIERKWRRRVCTYVLLIFDSRFRPAKKLERCPRADLVVNPYRKIYVCERDGLKILKRKKKKKWAQRDKQ